MGIESDTTDSVESVLSTVANDLSRSSSVAGIRILSVQIVMSADDDREDSAELTETAQTGNASLLKASAPRQFVDSLLEPAPVQSATSGSSAAAEDDSPTLFLIDRKGRLRRRYTAETASVSKIIADIGFVLPEFDPVDFGYPVSAQAPKTTYLAQPPEILDLEWLDAAAGRQISELEGSSINTDFRFTDQRESSGITFLPQIVDDQRWRLLVNHYDHGNGICVADANGDGHMDLFFVSQTGHNELYFGNGQGQFRNATQESGTAFPGRICVTASFADMDNDGDPDLYLTTVRFGNVLLENDGSGHFTDISEESGLDWTGHSSSPLIFDYDRDGLLDVFLCNVGRYTTEEFAALQIDSTSSLPKGEVPSYYVGRKDAFAGHLRPEDTETSRLFRNLGDLKFDDVTEDTGLTSTGWSGEATQLDGNHDGWPDLYVLNMQGHDEYFENQAGQRFVKKTDELFAATPWGAMGVKAFDFDNNGLADLFITDMHSDMSEDIGVEREREKSDMQWPPAFLGSNERNIFGNAFFLQKSPGVFEEVSDAIHAENYWPWGLSVGDLNADGYQDAFLASSMCFPYRYGINSVLLNDHGTRFRHSEFAVGVEPRNFGMRLKAWFDVPEQTAGNEHPMSSGREGGVQVWSCLGTRSSVLLDLDGDGDLDIVTSEFNSPPQVLVSDLVQRHPETASLQIRLAGRKSNREGLGTRVTVTAGDDRYMEIYDGRSGYLSQSSAPLYFGLGTHRKVDSIEVAWPSGQTESITGPIEPGQLLVIEEME